MTVSSSPAINEAFMCCPGLTALKKNLTEKDREKKNKFQVMQNV